MLSVRWERQCGHRGTASLVEPRGSSSPGPRDRGGSHRGAPAAAGGTDSPARPHTAEAHPAELLPPPLLHARSALPRPRAWLEGQRRLIGGCAQGVACVTWMGEYAPFRWREGVARRRGDVRERREAAPGRALVVPRSLSRCAPAPLPPRPRYGSTARRCVPPARRRLRRCRGRTGAGGAACRGSLGPAGPQPPPAD